MFSAGCEIIKHVLFVFQSAAIIPFLAIFAAAAQVGLHVDAAIAHPVLNAKTEIRPKRFVEAAILARRYPEAKIVVSGGSGALILEGEGDADTAPRLPGCIRGKR